MSNEDDKERTINMPADAGTTTKKRRASGPRQARPVFGIVTYTDDQGAPVQLDKARLNVVLERDSAKIVELLTGGDSSLQNAAVVKVDLPQPKQREQAAASA